MTGMDRARWALLAAAAVLTLVAGCTASEQDPPTVAPTTTEPSPTDTAAEGSVDESGVLTEPALQAVAPSWEASRFLGIIAAPAGYDYGGECHDSAWEVLYLTEDATGSGRSFQASTGARPEPMLTISVVELSGSDRTESLDALEHQLTSCVGEGPAGEVLQEAAPETDEWSGLHIVSEDRDLYWAAYERGIVLAQMEPGLATLGSSLGAEVRAVLALQLEQLG